MKWDSIGFWVFVFGIVCLCILGKGKRSMGISIVVMRYWEFMSIVWRLNFGIELRLFFNLFLLISFLKLRLFSCFMFMLGYYLFYSIFYFFIFFCFFFVYFINCLIFLGGYFICVNVKYCLMFCRYFFVILFFMICFFFLLWSFFFVLCLWILIMVILIG